MSTTPEKKERWDTATLIALVGETRTTRRGYAVRVEAIEVPGYGPRVRLVLVHNGERKHRFDLTHCQSAELRPLLASAVALTGGRR